MTEKTTMTGVMIMVTTTCHFVCDNDHYHMEEEERPTTTGEMTGLREGTTTTMMTRMTAMTASMQKR